MDDKRADEFDPDDILKGWQTPPQGRGDGPAIDLDGLLGSVARKARGDLDADEALRQRPEEEWQPSGAAPLDVLERRSMAEADAVEDLPFVEIIDAAPATAIDDLDSIGAAAAAAARAEAIEWVERAGDPAMREAPTFEPVRHPRLAAAWQPGVWLFASRQLNDGDTRVVQTPHGPVIETLPPLHLVALWAPQRLDQPLLPRWPLRAALVAAEERTPVEAVLAWLPADAGDAPLCLLHADADDPGAPHPADWALIADLVRHHDAGLKPQQLELLAALIESEQAANFERLNAAYAADAGGGAVALPKRRP
jgi:hypothetical protein